VNNGSGKVDFTGFNPIIISPILENTISIINTEEVKQL
jgi:hypothetical protein